MQDIGRLVPPSRARFSRAFLDEMMQRGHPAADRAIALLSEEAYDADGGQLGRLRELARDGEVAALEFFERAEARPAWLEPRRIERGQRLALASIRHYGLSLTHSLFAGPVFAEQRARSIAALAAGVRAKLGSMAGPACPYPA